MWIPLPLISAFSQASWMSMGKALLQELPSARFIIFLRLPFIPMLAVALLVMEPPGSGLEFWGLCLAISSLECFRMVCLSRGIRKDFYATYSLFNMAPLFVLLLAPQVLGETPTPPLIAGVVCVCLGGFVFYHSGKFQLAGLMAAMIQAFSLTLAKKALTLSSPEYFMFQVFGISTLMLITTEIVRGRANECARRYRQLSLRFVPLSFMNLMALVPFLFALDMTTAMNFSVLFRTNLIFGFVLSVVWLKEYDGWRWKLGGALLILVGSLFTIIAPAAA